MLFVCFSRILSRLSNFVAGEPGAQGASPPSLSSSMQKMLSKSFLFHRPKSKINNFLFFSNSLLGKPEEEGEGEGNSTRTVCSIYGTLQRNGGPNSIFACLLFFKTFYMGADACRSINNSSSQRRARSSIFSPLEKYFFP